MSAAITPSRVARKIAGDLWPDVQIQRKIGAGAYGFTCAGHGGIVAVHGAADIPESAWTVARNAGKTELVAVETYGRRARYFTTERYTRDSLARLRGTAGVQVFECWIGEEDCDWSLIVLAQPALAAGGIAGGYFSSAYSPEELLADARDTAERWNTVTLFALDRAPAVEAFAGAALQVTS